MTTSIPSSHPPAAQEPPAREFSPKKPFARLPLLAGKGFIPIGFFARLPLAMLTVGTLTLITSVSGSHAVGGTAAGVLGIGCALGAPLLGALADSKGQRPVLLVASVLNSLAVLALIMAAYFVPGDDHGLSAAGPVFAAAFAAGASCPQVGPLARVRWMALTAGGGTDKHAQDLDAALSYESTADEVTFVFGPALVGILASLVSPWLPLALAAALTITLVPAFAVHGTHRSVLPPGKTGLRIHTKRDQSGSAPQRLRSRVSLALPVLAMVCMGTFFGSTQTALSAFSASFATAELAGLLYAVMGLSSAATALSVAYWPGRFSMIGRWLVSAGLMSGLALLLLLPVSAASMILLLLVLGLPVGPLMVTVFAIGGLVAPAGKLGTTMTALASGIVAGTALGSSLGGLMAQNHGYSASFLIPVGAAVALFLLGAVAAVVIPKRPSPAL